jgi:hypothetical protein
MTAGTASVQLPRFPFAESMKALGMTLIVYGHVAHATTVPLTPPIYLKQLGVAFFLFVTGFTLARERRGALAAVAHRLQPIYGYGIGLALLISLLGAVTGSGLALSNFLPFAAGANVFRDSFPANPTTWYVGTYVHIVLLWALCLRHATIRPWMIAAAVAIEIPVRAALIPYAGSYVAYMLFTNWSAVFLFGMYSGQRQVERHRIDPRTAVRPLGMLAIWLVASAIGFRAIGILPTFPFMTIAGVPDVLSAALVSAGASALYLGTTGLVFAVTSRFGAAAPVHFIARNSLIIFLAHMPLYFALAPVLSDMGLSYWARAAVQFTVCLPGLALVSEAIRAAVHSTRVRWPLSAIRTASTG